METWANVVNRIDAEYQAFMAYIDSELDGMKPTEEERGRYWKKWGKGESNNNAVNNGQRGLPSSNQSDYNILSGESVGHQSEWVWKGKDYKTKEALIETTKNPKCDPIPDDGLPVYTLPNIDVLDLTDRFNEHLAKIFDYFSSLSPDNILSPGGYISSIITFGSVQYYGRNSDFLNLKQNRSFKSGGRYSSEYFENDDFGNFAYGVAARAAKIDLITTIQGAGAFGLLNNSQKNWLNIFGVFDEWKDTEMIIRGYFWRIRK